MSLVAEEIVLIVLQRVGSVKIESIMRSTRRQRAYNRAKQVAIAPRICQNAEWFQLLHKILPDIRIYLFRSKPMHHQRCRLFSAQAQQKMWRCMRMIATISQSSL